VAVEDATSRAWMAKFDPSAVAERRDAVIDRGRAQRRNAQHG
jgi:enoyl-CoA hydratase